MYSLCIETAEVRGKRSWVHVIRCTSSQFLSERAHIFGFRLFQISFVGVVCNQSKTKKKSALLVGDSGEVITEHATLTTKKASTRAEIQVLELAKQFLSPTDSQPTPKENDVVDNATALGKNTQRE